MGRPRLGTLTRNVRVVLVCEDTQHEVFVRRFLKEMGWRVRDIRVEKAPQGRGSGEQFVRENYPSELRSFRPKPGRRALIAVVDGDGRGVDGRLGDFERACVEQGVPSRTDEETVLLLVPTRAIETWLAYLDGNIVDESHSGYRRLAHERECRRHVDVLAGMCRDRALRLPAPLSLVAACEEYGRLRSLPA